MSGMSIILCLFVLTSIHQRTMRWMDDHRSGLEDKAAQRPLALGGVESADVSQRP